MRLARALRQLTLFLARNVVTRALPFMARFAKVRVAPAKPLGNRATEFALKLDKVRSVCAAIRVTETESLG